MAGWKTGRVAWGLTYDALSPIRKIRCCLCSTARFDWFMAESFFIRATVNIGNTNSFAERALDLGSYVDALSQSVLKVHRADVAFTDNAGRSLSMSAADTAAVAQFQLTTQSQSDIVLPSDRSVIASGKIEAYTPSITTSPLAASSSNSFDIAPQLYTNGYLVATESIYLGGTANTTFAGNVYLSIVLECTVEKMSQSKAMALALSQQ